MNHFASSLNNSRLLTLFLFTITLELALMGSGRLLEVGPVTLRMVLFVAGMTYTVVICCIRRVIPLSSWILLSTYVLVLLIAAIIGAANRAPLNLIVEDVKPLAYFLLLPFFDVLINSRSRVEGIVSIIKFSAIFMAGAYVAVLWLVVTGRIGFATLYSFLGRFSEQELFFRGETGVFFYKGFLYLCAGVIFFAFSKSIIGKIVAFFLLGAIFATGTRGFVLGLAVVTLLYLCVWSRHRVLGSILAIGLIAAGPTYLAASADRSVSDVIRITTIKEVTNETDLTSMFVGHGFGVGVAERPIHMEISYLEIFHKQGVLGLGWWLLLFSVFIRRFQRTLRDADSRKSAIPFFLCGLFVFIESFTNPYINNPIGLSLLMICMASIGYISKAALDNSTSSSVLL